MKEFSVDLNGRGFSCCENLGGFKWRLCTGTFWDSFLGSEKGGSQLVLQCFLIRIEKHVFLCVWDMNHEWLWIIMKSEFTCYSPSSCKFQAHPSSAYNSLSFKAAQSSMVWIRKDWEDNWRGGQGGVGFPWFSYVGCQFPMYFTTCIALHVLYDIALLCDLSIFWLSHSTVFRFHFFADPVNPTFPSSKNRVDRAVLP